MSQKEKAEKAARAASADRPDVAVEARHRHAELVERVDRARFEYFVRDAPTLADAEYDAMMRELQAIGHVDDHLLG